MRMPAMPAAMLVLVYGCIQNQQGWVADRAPGSFLSEEEQNAFCSRSQRQNSFQKENTNKEWVYYAMLGGVSEDPFIKRIFDKEMPTELQPLKRSVPAVTIRLTGVEA